MTTIKLSLILATYGRTQEIDRLFDSLACQWRQDCELIIVDQNPDERLVPHIARASAIGLSVQHLRMPKPNLSSARNLGLQQAKGLWVGFPDDDCWYENDTLEKLLHCQSQHPDWRGAISQWVEQDSNLPMGLMPANDSTLSLERWRRFRDGNASSITIFIDRQLLIDIGGFDTRLGVGQWFGAAEETDLIIRVLDRGVMLGRCRDAKVHHRFTAVVSATKNARTATILRARGTGALYSKHQLSAPVVLRGLVAPMLRSFWPWQGRTKLLQGWTVSLGRLQGAIAWRAKYGRS